MNNKASIGAIWIATVVIGIILIVSLSAVVVHAMGYRLLKTNNGIFHSGSSDEFVYLHFEKQALLEVNSLYVENPEREFYACLEGYYESNNTGESVDSIHFYVTDVTNVGFGTKTTGGNIDCSGRHQLGHIHSHPSGSCLHSTQDKQNVFKKRVMDGEVISVVICGPGEFGMIRHNNMLDQLIEVEA